MVDVIDVEKKRFDFLSTLYDEADGDRFKAFTRDYVGGKLRLDTIQSERIIDYLGNEGLIDTTKDTVAISHKGIKEVEAARKHPEEPTDHFPKNVINIGTMIDSQITQASADTTQLNILTADDRRGVEQIITLLKEHMDEIKLPPDQESDLRADMETVEAQLKSSKPKWAIIKESCGSIKENLQTVATVSTIAARVIQLLSMLHH